VKAPMLLARCSRADLVFEHRGGNDYRSTTPVLFSDTYTFHVLDRFVFDVCVVRRCECGCGVYASCDIDID
jgi:hypothetical protein